MKVALFIIGAFVGMASSLGLWAGQLAAAAIGFGLLCVPRARAFGLGLVAGLATFWAAVIILVWHTPRLGD